VATGSGLAVSGAEATATASLSNSKITFSSDKIVVKGNFDFSMSVDAVFAARVAQTKEWKVEIGTFFDITIFVLVTSSVGLNVEGRVAGTLEMPVNFDVCLQKYSTWNQVPYWKSCGGGGLNSYNLKYNTGAEASAVGSMTVTQGLFFQSVQRVWAIGVETSADITFGTQDGCKLTSENYVLLLLKGLPMCGGNFGRFGLTFFRSTTTQPCR